MKRHTLSICSALLLAAAACNKSEIPDDATSPRQTPVIIEATGLYDLQPAPASRATVDGNWQGVQKVALKMGDEVKEYTVSTSDADGYKCATLACTADPFYWTNRNPITVTAWWPLDEADITRMPAVKVAEDQSQLADFQKSDFISAEEQTVEFDAPKLTFTHRTARVVVNLTAGDGIASLEGATVSLVSLSETDGNPASITACNTAGNTFEALTAPQTVSAGKCFIRVELGGGTFDFCPKNDVALAAGRRCTYNLRVEATGLTLEGSSIGGWNNDGGESGAAEDLGYIYDEATHTYIVYNANGLLAWAEAARKDMSLNCTLTADITLPEVLDGESNWTPVGYYDAANDIYIGYTGTFEGGGHTITGLTIYLPGQNDVGMFGMIGQYGTVGKGTVQHLTLAGVKITGNNYVGGVAGSSYYGTLTDCYAASDVTGNWYVGGVAGCNVSGPVTACYHAAGTVSGSIEVGGVVGWNYKGTLTACYATGDVSGDADVGGVVGYNNATVTGCYHAAGDVTGTGDAVGGVAGYNWNGTLTACYWSNNLDAGIGDSSGDVTKVDGTDVTWQTAQSGMNEAIETWNDNHANNPCNWRYDETDAATPPVLIPAN